MPRVCDFCQNLDAILFCRADSAFLCSACDFKVHQANKVASRHERVRICGGCELVLPNFTSKPEVAVSCAACTIKVHSANTHAGKHEQFQLVPINVAPYEARNEIADSLCVRDVGSNQYPDITAHGNILDQAHVPDMGIIQPEDDNDVVDDKRFASWLVQHDPKDKESASMESKKGLLEWEEENFRHIESFLLSEPCEEDGCLHLEDSLVPSLVHTSLVAYNAFQLDEARHTQEIVSRSRSLTSTMGMDLVPDVALNCMSATDTPCLDYLGHLCNSIAREARVLRYKEKRKNRNFEKIIRYASRKAYAEARPRINGRFAKRLFEVSKQLL